MSIIFKSKIAENYDYLKPEKATAAVAKVIKTAFSFGSGKRGPAVKTVPRETIIIWPKSDLAILVNLRAIGVTYKVCGVTLGRSANSCGSAIQTNNLYSAVQTRRDQLIKEALNDT